MKNIKKRLLVFLLTAVMVVASAVSAFAAETQSNEVTVAEFTVGGNNSVSSSDDGTVGVRIGVNSTGYCYPVLNSYVGIKKAFHVATGCDSGAGIVYLKLYNKKGKLVSNDWMMGVNDYAYWFLTFPSSGTYTLKATTNATTAVVTLYCWWEQ